MTRRHRRRYRRGPLVGVATVALALLLATGGRAAFRAHVADKTGRTDIKGITCLHCHLPVSAPTTRGTADASGYVSPSDLVVAPDGRHLYVSASDGNEILRVDLEQFQVTGRVAVGTRPLGLALSPDGSLLAVACQVADEIVLVTTDDLAVSHRLPSASGPTDVTFITPRRLAVTHGDSRDLTLLDVDGSRRPRRLPAGQEPYAVDGSADGKVVAAVSRVVKPMPDGVMPGAVLTLVDGESGRIRRQHLLRSSHLSEAVAVSADGSFVLVPVVRFRHFLPTTQVARGAVMTSALTYLETEPDGAVIHFPLDEVNAYFADPSGLVLTPDETLAFVASGGTDMISVVDLTALRAVAAGLDGPGRDAIADDLGAFHRYVVARIPTGANPRNMAVTPDGRTLLVAEHLDDSVAVIDIGTLQVTRHIDLGGDREQTAARRGARVFHDATGTFQSEFSCRSCHPDGHTDGLTWDFEIDGIGRERLETRSLRGVRDTAPFKWSGKNPDLKTQCGRRFSRVLMRSAPFKPQQLADLVTYIESLPLPPRRSELLDPEAVERGRLLFFRQVAGNGEVIPKAQRCDTCHRPPLFTDRLKADVGTSGGFDTPHLTGVGMSPPYLHDGRALSLEEIWTVHSPEDTHGITNDLDKVQLNDLILYLRTL
jgi:YVTN family beta-propeller protein